VASRCGVVDSRGARVQVSTQSEQWLEVHEAASMNLRWQAMPQLQALAETAWQHVATTPKRSPAVLALGAGCFLLMFVVLMCE
jgi:hypothetical protein